MVERRIVPSAAAGASKPCVELRFRERNDARRRMLRMLTLIDEYTRECLAIRVARRLGRYEVIEALADVMLYRGIPENIRSDNGPEFVAEELREGAGEGGHGDAVHRTGEPLGERLLRKFQRKVARRVPERRDFLFAEGGPGSDREMASGL